MGALLAGGRGTRLERGDKALVTVGGISMIARAHDCLSPQVDRIVANTNAPADRFAFLGVPVVQDRFVSASGAGPLAGIHAVLHWARREIGTSALVFTVPVDAPFLPSDLVSRLQKARDQAQADIAVASSGGRVHPVVACWPLDILDALEQALSDDVRKIDRFTSAYRVARVEWGVSPVDPFFNVNTADNLSAAERLVHTLSGSPA